MSAADGFARNTHRAAVRNIMAEKVVSLKEKYSITYESWNIYIPLAFSTNK